MKTFLDFLYMIFALGNFESFESPLPPIPCAPGTPIPEDTKDIRYNRSADGRFIERWKVEGDIYGTDPLMLWLGYMPMLAGILLTILFFFGYVVWPVIGLVSLVTGIFVFFVFGTVTPPQTLLIRKFLGGAEYFMNTVPFVSDKMEWETVPGLQIPMRSDGKSDNSIRSMMLLKTRRTDANGKEEPLLEGEDEAAKREGRKSNNYDWSQVDIRFSGTILLRIDLHRPNSVMTSFFDDFRGRPKDDDKTDAEDLRQRCDRLFRSTIIDAIDTILQTIEWEDAVDNVSEINRRLKIELPRHLQAFPIIIEEVLLGEAFGDPITARNRQAKARLDATTAEKVAVADRDKRIAEAKAKATGDIETAQQQSKARIETAKADLAARIEEQETELNAAIKTAAALKEVQKVENLNAKIALLPLIRRLEALKDTTATAVAARLLDLDPMQVKEVLVEGAKALGAAQTPDTILSVANGSKTDSFQLPAIIQAFQTVFDRLAPTASTTTH